MTEWLKVRAWKVRIPQKGIVGSNPAFSAKGKRNLRSRLSEKGLTKKICFLGACGFSEIRFPKEIFRSTLQGSPTGIIGRNEVNEDNYRSIRDQLSELSQARQRTKISGED